VLIAIDLLVAGGRVLWNVFEGFTTGVLAALGLDVDELLGDGGADHGDQATRASRGRWPGRWMGLW